MTMEAVGPSRLALFTPYSIAQPRSRNDDLRVK